MILSSLVVGMFGTNCYLVGCAETGEGVIIDPGADGKRILSAVRSLGLTVKYIINTHGHLDHTGANARLVESLGVPVYLHRADLNLYRNPGFGLGLVLRRQPEPERFLQDGDRVDFGKHSFTVLETPGHTKGGITLSMPGIAFTGDTLFAGSIGRTDLAGGSQNELMATITGRLMQMPPETVLYPGHGPHTTVAAEAQSNPFIRG